jgi:hypothetical protein
MESKGWNNGTLEYWEDGEDFLPIGHPAMANPHDFDHASLVVNFINDSVLAGPYPPVIH